MMHRACTNQPDVLAAASGGGALPEALAAHLASCPSCREQVEAVAFVRRLADAPDLSHPLPDPAVIWWKAQLLRRWQAERAAAAPIERMRWIELGAGVASLAVFVLWQWQPLVDLIERAIPVGIAAASAAPQAANPLALVLLAGATASIGAIVLASLHRRLSGVSN